MRAYRLKQPRRVALVEPRCAEGDDLAVGAYDDCVEFRVLRRRPSDAHYPQREFAMSALTDCPRDVANVQPALAPRVDPG